MESANKAGGLAAHAVLERAGSRESPAQIFEHYRPPEWESFKQADEERYRQGQPNMFDTDMPASRRAALLARYGAG